MHFNKIYELINVLDDKSKHSEKALYKVKKDK